MVFVNSRGAALIAVSLAATLFAVTLSCKWHPTQYGFFIGLLISFATFNQVMLGVWGINAFYLMYKALVAGSGKGEAERSLQQFEKDQREWPRVTIQLPIFNERYVIERLLQCCVKIEYPPDKLEIQVLDDSNDGTAEIVADCVAKLQKTTPVPIFHIVRQSRTNFKAGALAQGTSRARGEFLALFDADFLPEPGFLKLTIPSFVNPQVGCVQCRWGHLNADYSMFTMLQAMAHDSHFVVEQYAKCKGGFLFNFNGTAGVWRRQCIQEAGDWSGDTLAEDLDLSYRAQLKGWKIHYLRDVVVPAEVPLSLTALRKQQARWAKGSMQTALKIIGSVWDSQILTNLQKLIATAHLFGYSVHPFMLFNLLCTVCLFFLVPQQPVDYVFIVICIIAVGPPVLVAFAQLFLGQAKRVFYLPMLLLLAHGLCLNNTSAVFEAFKGVGHGVFERTPKFGNLQLQDKWAGTGYAKALKSVGLPYGEIVMSGLLLLVIGWGLTQPFSPTLFWLLFFFLGFLYLVFLHFQEFLQIQSAFQKRNKSD